MGSFKSVSHWHLETCRKTGDCVHCRKRSEMQEVEVTTTAVISGQPKAGAVTLSPRLGLLHSAQGWGCHTQLNTAAVSHKQSIQSQKYSKQNNHLAESKYKFELTMSKTKQRNVTWKQNMQYWSTYINISDVTVRSKYDVSGVSLSETNHTHRWWCHCHKQKS